MQFYGSRAISLDSQHVSASPEAVLNQPKTRWISRRTAVNVFFVLLTLALSGAAPGQIARAAGTVAASPTTVAFGTVAVNSINSYEVILKNTGSSTLTLSSQSLHGTYFGVSGLTLPKSIAAGATTYFFVSFIPKSTGVYSGYLQLFSNASNSTMQISFSGTVATPGVLSGTPSSIAFGSVPIGTTNTQTVQLKNTGGIALTLLSASVSGTGFKASGLTFPYVLSPAHAVNLTAAFAPTASGTVSGSISVQILSSLTLLKIGLSGSGVTSTKALSFSSSSLSFGNELVGGSSTEAVTVKNTGNASVSVSQVTLTGTGFSVSGGIAGATIAPGQSAQMNVTFAPKASGSVSGKVTLTSTATNSPASLSVSGTGISSATHAVTLNWSPSTTAGVAGYNIYRSTTSGSSFAKISSTLLSGLSYTDAGVSSGKTYYYVVTAVTQTGAESAFSGQIAATVP